MDEQRVVSLAVKVTDQMINSMRSIKLWTKFLSIMGFIGTGFIVLLGIFVLLVGSLLPQAQGAKIPTAMGLLYILCSFIYIIPSLYLFKYSSALGRFLENKRESEMDSAFSHQKSFWKFMGILCVIGMILAIVGIIAAIAIPLLLKH